MPLEERRIGNGDDVEADLSAPVLSQPHRKKHPIMTHEDFDRIVYDCHSLYQTRPDLLDGTYYDHLRALDNRLGLRISTADKFNNVVLMANNLLMFNRVRMLEEKRYRWPWSERRRTLDLITMPMDD